jgi:hypothetical protein
MGNLCCAREHSVQFFVNFFTQLNCTVYQYIGTKMMLHFLYSIYYELRACICFGYYLLIFRRRCTNNW